MFRLMREYPSMTICIYLFSAMISHYFMEYAIKRMSQERTLSEAHKDVLFAFTLTPFLNTAYASLCLIQFSRGFLMGKRFKK
jgi:hypothetical protein